MTPLAETIQYSKSGIPSGSIYSMVEICWSVAFLLTGILDFANGKLVILRGMLTRVLAEIARIGKEAAKGFYGCRQ